MEADQRLGVLRTCQNHHGGAGKKKKTILFGSTLEAQATSIPNGAP